MFIHGQQIQIYCKTNVRGSVEFQSAHVKWPWVLTLNGGASGGRVGYIINNSVASLMELVGYRAEANTGM